MDWIINMISTDNDMGLMPKEQIVMDKILECYSAFKELDYQHPNDAKQVVDCVHGIQDLLALRIVRRLYPKGWKTYSKESMVYDNITKLNKGE